MVDYIKSEWYRQKHNKGLWMTVLGAVLLMIGIPALIAQFQAGLACTMFAVRSFSSFMSGVWCMAVVFISMMENHEKLKQGALKNVISFGIPREQIILGKFLSGLWFCTVLYIILPLIYSGASLLFLEHSNMGEFQELARAFLGVYPLCVSMMALSLVLIVNMGNTFLCGLAIMGIAAFLPRSLQIFGLRYPILEKIADWFPGLLTSAWTTDAGMAKCWISGTFWTILALTAGSFWLKKREVK